MSENQEPEERVGWFGWAWVAGVSLYAVARALIAWPTLGQYGVNPWVFLAIDLGTAPPYGYAQVRLVKAISHRHAGAVQGWAAVVLVTFMAPYVYIFVAGSGELPVFGYVIVVLLVIIFALASLARMRDALRRERERKPTAEVELG